jgi:hypothetical protein
MVKPSSGSRPAVLTQDQVNELARGNHHDVARMLRATRAESAHEEDHPAEARSRPVNLSAKDIEGIRRSGRATGGLAKKIAEAARPKQTAQRKAKAGPAAKRATSAPTLKPTDPNAPGGPGRRR